MKILVIYSLAAKRKRSTIVDHLYSFRNYAKEAEFHYCNTLTKIPGYLKFVKYDGIILHYTFLSNKWDPDIWSLLLPGVKVLAKIKGAKVALPQDEYVYNDAICRFFKEHGIESVFTCAGPSDYQNFYPKEKSGLKHYFTTYPGFVDENALDYVKRHNKEMEAREIDIGYRARNLPFWLGRFSQTKGEIAKVFLRYKDKTSLKMDISTKDADVFYGRKWLDFIMNCRAMLGCLGGASLLDPDGQIRKKVENYVKKKPHASFDEVEKACFPGKDYKINLFTLSPRHFECAMAKTCQVLVEGDYHGIMKPNVHFIEIKKDYSNVAEVLQKVADIKLCRRIADNAYRDLIESGQYTYKKFACDVINHIREISHGETGGFFNDLKFKCITPILRLRTPLERVRHFFLLPGPWRRMAIAILPKSITKKLRKIKRYLNR